jgi:NADPH2:quinone reductase
MKAILVHELGSIDAGRLVELPTPQPGPGQVLIEVHAVPVNYVDIVQITGRYQFMPKMPYTPGKGPAGIVRGLGAGVTGLAVGDRVIGMNEHSGYAEMILVGQQDVYRLPDALSFVDAAAMSLGFDTSWMALRERARIQAGDKVLVLGATGAVGNAAVQLAKAMGAGVVMAAVSSPDKAAEVTAAGADVAIDLSQPDLKESLRAQVFAATGGHGADVIIDPVGGAIFEAAIRAIAWRGRLVVLGFAAGHIPQVKVNYLMLKNCEVSGMQISDYRRRTPELMRQCFEEIFAFWSAGKIKAPPSTTMPLADYAKAMHAIEARTAKGRIVLLPRGA